MSATINTNSSFSDVPLGLKLQQTITSPGSVTIPSNIHRVYAVCIGGGGSGGSSAQAGGGGGGGSGGGATGNGGNGILYIFY